jgi:hypothetical protein
MEGFSSFQVTRLEEKKRKKEFLRKKYEKQI